MDNHSADRDVFQVLTVHLGDQLFAVPILKVQDVLQTQSLTPVPMAKPYIEGVMNLRGRIVTVINLYKRIKGDSGHKRRDPMNVVIENNGELYSILVDKVGDVITLDREEIEDPPLTLETSWRQVIEGVYQLEHKIVLLLDVEKILHAQKTPLMVVQ